MKLFARKNTGAAAVEALLDLVGAVYELVDVEKHEDGSVPPWFMEINPRGEVPVLQLDDGSIMTESAAIMIYVADLYPRVGLAPAATKASRAQYLRWMVYFAASPYNADLRMYYAERFSINPSHAKAIKQKAIIDLNRDFDIFAKQLQEGPFVLGANVSAVDIYVSMLLTWSEDIAALFVRQPKLKHLHDAVCTIPAVRNVWQRNSMM